VCGQRLHIPAQVCEFLVDSLQRHRGVCVCLSEGGWRLDVVESVDFTRHSCLIKVFLESLRVSVCETGGCAETNWMTQQLAGTGGTYVGGDVRWRCEMSMSMSLSLFFI
jgi:hypothetical protein